MGDVINLRRLRSAPKNNSRRNRRRPTGRGLAEPKSETHAGPNSVQVRASDLLDQHRIDGEGNAVMKIARGETLDRGRGSQDQRQP